MKRAYCAIAGVSFWSGGAMGKRIHGRRRFVGSRKRWFSVVVHPNAHLVDTMQAVGTRLTNALTWLIAVVMTAVAVMPPVRVGCECVGVTEWAAAAEPTCAVGSVDSCCQPAVPESDERDESSDDPASPCEHGCPCQTGCCVMGRPVLVDASSRMEGEPAPRAVGVALAGPQICVAGVHAGKLLRPPRA